MDKHNYKKYYYKDRNRHHHHRRESYHRSRSKNNHSKYNKYYERRDKSRNHRHRHSYYDKDKRSPSSSSFYSKRSKSKSLSKSSCSTEKIPITKPISGFHDKNESNEIILKNNNQLVTRSNFNVITNKYQNYSYIDINDINNIDNKVYIFNLPEINEDEITQYFTTLLNNLNPNNNNISPIKSITKKDNGFYYEIELTNKNNVNILKNFDRIEFRGYNIRILDTEKFVSEYNDSMGKNVLPDQIKPNNSIIKAGLDIVNHNIRNTILISNIPSNFPETEILNIVKSFGEIKNYRYIEGRIIYEYLNGNNTDKAIKGIDGKIIGINKLKAVRLYNNESGDIYNDYGNRNIAKKIIVDSLKQEDPVNNINIPSSLNNPNEIESKFSNKKITTLTVKPSSIIPSRVVLFINCLTPEDLMDDEEYEDILRDFREECMKYGTVLNIEIPRPDKESGTCRDCVGKVFVKFLKLESAKKARFNLSGRLFNGRICVASFYKEMSYEVREFEFNED